ncbi:AMMECR1 domain protein [Pyrolobus fumarii 1A]|uniref:Protein Pyrfu_1076 n=1 Tax=Pyrolobus fumarii (strain DSM 11204 / 1A) TaxID=694429 RepID=G0EF47_PYRF1|nr:TIGR00296 family protein [Pyrolobus fumarii]AEM38944.1 AMMECR1 domain protein [Pyrolobus fumarii 1A]
MARIEQVRPEELRFEEGAFLVRLARRAVEYYFETGKKLEPPEDTPERLWRPGAAFVTIQVFRSYEVRELRGCIGYVEAVKPLVEAVIDVALQSAFEDPRFPPLRREELPMVTFEVSVLGPLEELPRDPESRPRSFEIGRHGLVARRGWFQGLLLPEVPVEYLWDEETFLAETCVKAGMEPSCWLDPETEFYRFSGRIWRERDPETRVIEERDLREELRRRLGVAQG